MVDGFQRCMGGKVNLVGYGLEMGVKKSNRLKEIFKNVWIYLKLRQGIFIEDQIWVGGDFQLCFNYIEFEVFLR